MMHSTCALLYSILHLAQTDFVVAKYCSIHRCGVSMPGVSPLFCRQVKGPAEATAPRARQASIAGAIAAGSASSTNSKANQAQGSASGVAEVSTNGTSRAENARGESATPVTDCFHEETVERDAQGASIGNQEDDGEHVQQEEDREVDGVRNDHREGEGEGEGERGDFAHDGEGDEDNDKDDYDYDDEEVDEEDLEEDIEEQDGDGHDREGGEDKRPESGLSPGDHDTGGVERAQRRAMAIAAAIKRGNTRKNEAATASTDANVTAGEPGTKCRGPETSVAVYLTEVEHELQQSKAKAESRAMHALSSKLLPLLIARLPEVLGSVSAAEERPCQ